MQVVDGTTIYFNDPPPKINEAPSLDNTTPEAISPTVSLSQAAQPTESTGAPEIESSVREEADLDLTLQTDGTAALSDNPGAAKTSNQENVVTNDIELTDPASVVEEIKTASPVADDAKHQAPGAADVKTGHTEDVVSEIKHEEPADTESETESGDYETEDVDEIQSDDYIEELTDEQKAKLQETITKLKAGDINEEELVKPADQAEPEETVRLSDDLKIEDTEELKKVEVEKSVTTPDGDREEENSKVEIRSENVEIEEEHFNGTEVEGVTETISEEEHFKATEVEGGTETITEEYSGEEGKQEENQLEQVVTPETGTDHQNETIEVEPDEEDIVSPEKDLEGLQPVELKNILLEEVAENANDVQIEEQVQHIHDGEVHDHLGEGVVEKVAENVPDFFQPAEQKFDVPLSQQFSAASSGSMGEEVDQITTPSPLVVDMEEVEDVYTPAFQTTTTPTTDNSQNEASETLNEVPTEEPSAGGLFGSLTNMFGSSTESPTQTSQEEGQTKLLYFYASSPGFWDNSVFSFQGRPKYLFLFLFGYLLHAFASVLQYLQLQI